MQKLVGKINGYIVSISKESKVIYFTGDTIYSHKFVKALPNGSVFYFC